MVCL
jgi:hypothetical protein